MTGYVLDTSVVCKWFSDRNESDLENAQDLRRGILEGDYSITIPDLLFYELSNALRFNPGLSSEEVNEAVEAVFQLEFDVRNISADLATNAVKLAYSFNVTVYDACFLALAQNERKMLITADYKFRERVKGAKNILGLADFTPIPGGKKRKRPSTLKDFRGVLSAKEKTGRRN